MIQVFLGIFIWLLTTIVTFGLDLNLAPGLSARNFFAFALAGLLLLNYAVTRKAPTQPPNVLPALGLLIGYAALSILIAGFVAQYPNYSILKSFLTLKTTYIDRALFFAIFAFGVNTVDQSRKLINTMLLAISAANLVTILKVTGHFDVGPSIYGDEFGTSRRVFGAFGHANETGELIICLLPAYIAAVESAKGWFQKALWTCATLASVVVLVLVSSRGALLGLLIGGVWTAWLCRGHFSLARVGKWMAGIGAGLVVLLPIVGWRYWDLLVRRFTDVSFSSFDDVSSGRGHIWAQCIEKMLESPLTFITGFGYNSWEVMGFELVAHNEFLTLYFDVGLLGLICLLVAFRQSVVSSLATLRVIRNEVSRRYLLAFIFGVIALGVSLMFGTMYLPWFFVWPYFALGLRMAIEAPREERIAQRQAAEGTSGATAPAAPTKPQGPTYGWQKRLPSRRVHIGT